MQRAIARDQRIARRLLIPDRIRGTERSWFRDDGMKVVAGALGGADGTTANKIAMGVACDDQHRAIVALKRQLTGTAARVRFG